MVFQSAPADCRREKVAALTPVISDITFQSAPADCRREKPGNRPLLSGHSGFNPLPPTVGGRRCSSALRRTLSRVSIRSRRPVGGRRLPVTVATVPSMVSIRSRRLSAGEVQQSVRPLVRSKFQSAPADCRREKLRPDQPILTPSMFQSAPADCRREKHQLAYPLVPRHQFQSAPADCRREKPRAASARGRPTCFNPLPPTVGGRSQTAQKRPQGWEFQSAPADCRREKSIDVRSPAAASVSIRSRRLSAGEDRRRFRQAQQLAGFNPLPPTVGGRSMWPEDSAAAPGFQSAPADCRREKTEAIHAVEGLQKVSIRSRRLSAGEAGVVALCVTAVGVSIRSRRLSAGEG